MNSTKSILTTILYTPTYPHIDKDPLFMKYITGIFTLKTQKPKLCNVCDEDILFGYLKTRRLSAICVITVDYVTLNVMSVNFLPNKVLKLSRQLVINAK